MENDVSPQSIASWQTLQDSDVYITKIGGENAVDLGANADLVAARSATDKKQILVISAPRTADPVFSDLTHPLAADRDKLGRVKPGFNTTSHLIALAGCLSRGERSEAVELLERVRRFMMEIIRLQCERDGGNVEESIRFLSAPIHRFLDDVWSRIAACEPEDLMELGKDWVLKDDQGFLSITGLGETVARMLYGAYFAYRGMSAQTVDFDHLAAEAYGDDPRAVAESEERTAAAIAGMRDRVRDDIDALLGEHDVIVAGGYAPILGGQRGYSDKTGAFIARVAQDTGRDVAFVIEKQYPVMSADPRLVTGASVVPEMTYDFAMEAFGNVHGADGGAIHPEALAMLAHTDIDTYVLSPAEAEAGNITHIHRFDPKPGGIEMVAVRPIPTALQVRSTKMFNRPGFLRSMSEWFAGRGISVDQIFSSEVTISFTFTNGGVGDPVIAEFRQFLQEQYADDELELNVLRDRAALYCMGNNIAGVAPLSRMMRSLEEAEVDNIDYLTRGSRESIITIVDQKHAASALASLHSGCVH